MESERRGRKPVLIRVRNGRWVLTVFQFIGYFGRGFGRGDRGRGVVWLDRVGGRAPVVMITPDTIPDSRNHNETRKYHGRIVHALKANGDR